MALFPSRARLVVPGPLMVRLVLISRLLASVMVPPTLKLITSPGCAFVTASRSDPGPLSFVLVTLMLAAYAREVNNTKHTSREPSVRTVMAASVLVSEKDQRTDQLLINAELAESSSVYGPIR